MYSNLLMIYVTQHCSLLQPCRVL